MQDTPARDRTVIHFASAGLSEERAAVLAALCGRKDTPESRVIWLGDGPSPAGVQAGVRLRRGWRLRLPWAGGDALRRQLGLGAAATTVVHVWDARDLHDARLALGAIDACWIVEAAGESKPDESPTDVLWIAHDEREAAALRADGATSVATIPAAADADAIASAERDAVRMRLGIEPGALCVLTASPTDSAPAFNVGWAALLLQHVHAELRLLMPGWGAGADAIARLAETSRVPHVVARARGRATMAELAVAADVCVCAAEGDDLRIWAAAAGKRFVAPGAEPFACDSASIKSIAAAMLRALETPGATPAVDSQGADAWERRLDAYFTAYASCCCATA